MGDTTAGQPPRKRRAETRFCRVPQWLYGAGVSLQAIATYGWLHGKYGFLPVINPSYNTLADELHCSRGSVITYLKELVRVGAVRITVGGPKGRTINTYEIAFDAPHAFARGQPADHLKGADTSGVVSPLTSSGQSADQQPGQSGQRAVPEEEVSKTEEDSLSSLPSQRAAGEPPAAPVEREIEPLIQKLMTDHAATEQEATEVAAQIRREGKIGSLVGWARSEAGALDFKRRLAELRQQQRAVVPGPRPSIVTADTSRRDTECRGCDRPIKPGTPDQLCRDCAAQAA